MKHLTVLIAFLMTFGSQVNAFDPAHLQKLKDTNECIACDLSGANLNGADLSEAYLAYANLGTADLTSADLRGTDLDRANLGGADLNGANLAGATLKGASLNGADLIGAILCNTTMPDGSRRGESSIQSWLHVPRWHRCSSRLQSSCEVVSTSR